MIENMSLAEATAYVSGFLDGEGCFMLYWRKRGGFTVRIAVVNTNEHILNVIKDFIFVALGVKANLYTQESPEGSKPRWALQIGDQKSIEKLCLAVKPYVIIKRPQVDGLLEYLVLRKIEGKYGDLFADRKLALVELFKRLNKRGT